MSEARSWFEDEGTLVAALREVGAARDERSAPSIAGYEMLGEIGRGGQGCVWMARQLATRRIVAIKVLADPELATPAARRRLERETEIAAGLDHPGIVRILGGGQTAADEPYLVMEHVDGIPFDRFARSVDRAVPTIVALAAAACDALDEAHRRGVIHRDLKPDNVFLAQREGRTIVKLLDFGISKTIGEETLSLTKTGMVVGTPFYLAPEQARGDDVDQRIDVWAMGVLLYEMITGTTPFRAENYNKLIVRILTTRAEPPSTRQPRISKEIEQVIMTALSHDRDDRYADAGQMLVAFTKARRGEMPARPPHRAMPVDVDVDVVPGSGEEDLDPTEVSDAFRR